jgi:hypothetical protein
MFRVNKASLCSFRRIWSNSHKKIRRVCSTCIGSDVATAGLRGQVLANQTNKYFDKSIEADMYRWWEQSGYFKPAADATGGVSDRPTYVVPMVGNVVLRLVCGESFSVCWLRGVFSP